MRVFWACLKAEVLKGQRSFATWLSLTGTLANVLLFSLFWLFKPTEGTPISDKNPWDEFTLLFFNGIAFMMLPLYVIILTNLINYQEHRSGAWLNLFTLPLSKWPIYWGKQVYTLLHFIAAHALFVIGMVLSGGLIGLLWPSSGLLGSLPSMSLILSLALQTVVSILGLLAFHHWISWRFRQFIIPLTIGILGFVLASLLGPMWTGSPYFWYSTPLLYMPVQMNAVEVPTFLGIGLHLWMSLAFFLGFTVFGYWDVRRVQGKV